MSSTSSKKISVLFVGGFSIPRDGSQGGQIFACRSLVSCPLSKCVDWTLIDSTQRTNPPPHLLIRTWDALKRIVTLCWYLCFLRIDSVLIFSSLMGISPYEKGLMCILAKLFGKRVVLSTRSHPSLPQRLRKVFQLYVRLVLRLSDVVVCQSLIGQRDLERLFNVPISKTRVIPNWIDTRKFCQHEERSQPLQLPEQRTRIVYVGWLDPIKGLSYLLQAISLLATRRNDFELVLYGGGISERELKGLTAELGVNSYVRFEGWISNEKVPFALRDADIFVFPTLHEGMSNSLLQAMACGLPVVTTNVTSIPEIVTDQLNGLLVPPRSPIAIADALADLLEQPTKRRRMGIQNRMAILSNHTIDSTWPKLASALGIPTSTSEALSRDLITQENQPCVE